MRGACVVLLLAGCSFQLRESAIDGAIESDAPKLVDANAAEPALVQQAIASADNSNNPLVATLPARPAPGDLLIMIGASSRGGLTSVTGGGVATWTRATRALLNVNIELWYGTSDGTSAAVTIAYPPYGDPIWELATEWSGTGALDAATSMSGTASPAKAGGANVSVGDLVVFAVTDLQPNTFGTPAQATFTPLMPVSSMTTTQGAWYAIATSSDLMPSVTETAHSWEAAIATFHVAH